MAKRCDGRVVKATDLGSVGKPRGFKPLSQHNFCQFCCPGLQTLQITPKNRNLCFLHHLFLREQGLERVWARSWEIFKLFVSWSLLCWFPFIASSDDFSWWLGLDFGIPTPGGMVDQAWGDFQNTGELENQDFSLGMASSVRIYEGKVLHRSL